MSIGNQIRKLRKENGLTQKQLGEKCGIAEPTIRKYELGMLNPKLETLSKIAKALNVNISVFSHDNIIYFNNNPDKKIEEMTPEEIKEAIQMVPEAFENFRKAFEKLYEQFIEENSDSDDLLKLYYSELNHNGRKEAIKRIRELTFISEYTDKE